MTVHLATRTDVACATTSGRTSRSTGRLSEVTCSRCSKQYAQIVNAARDELIERKYMAKQEAAIEAVGLTDVWRYVNELPDSTTSHLVQGIVGSLAVGLHEMGYHAPTTGGTHA